MKNKRLTMGSYTFALGALALIAVILCNLLLGALPVSLTQWDLTPEATYTLSQLTKTLVGAMQEEVTVHLIAQNGQEDPTLLQLLERYKELSPKIKVNTVDPVIHPLFVSQYTDLKLNGNSLIVESAKRSRAVDYTEIYTMTTAEHLEYYYTYGEYYPDTFEGENALTSAINYVTTDVLPVAGILTGHGETELPASYLKMLQSVNLSAQTTVLLRTGLPKDCRLLIINAPSSDLSEAELEMLRSYLKEGNSVFYITTPSETELPLFRTLCEDFGLKTIPGTVLEEDPANYYASQFFIYPSMNSHATTDPLLENGFSPYLAVCHGIQTIAREGVTHTTLLESSSHSYSETSPKEEQPNRNEEEAKGPLSLAVLAQREDSARLLHFGSSSLTDEEVDPFSNGANRSLFLNTCSFLAGKTDTISIQGTSIAASYLSVSLAEGSLWTSVFCAVLPLGILAVGTFVWLKRRSR